MDDFELTTDNPCTFLHGIDPSETVNHCTNPNDKEILTKQINYYKQRDVQFLYFVTLVFMSTFVGTLFSLANSDTNGCIQLKEPIKNVVVWSSSFVMFMASMRVYFFRMYIQNPLISVFKINGHDKFDKFMNLTFVVLCLSLVGAFVAMYKYASEYQQLNSVITMCILIGLAIFTTGWYKLIVRRMARRVTEIIPIIAHADRI